MKPECTTTRDALIDDALGQADAAALVAARAHLDRCGDCQREVAALRVTIARVRKQKELLPSARFKPRLTAALDDVDERRVPLPTRREPAYLSMKMAAALLVALALGVALAVRAWQAPGDHGEMANAPPSIRFTQGRPREPEPTLPKQPDLFPKRPPSDHPQDPAVAVPEPTGDELERMRDRAAGELVELPPDARGDPSDAVPFDPTAPSGATPGGRVGAPEVASLPPVRRALDWLARNQRRDGSWTAGRGDASLDTGVTALALLALVSDGHLGRDGVTPRAGALDLAADRAASWLFDQQDRSDGAFRGGSDRAGAAFCHATACLALVERHVRSIAAGRLDRVAAARAQDRLEQALSRLEIELDALLHSDAGARCPGQVVAWSALALSTASTVSHWGIDFHLKGTTEQLVANVLKDLSNDQPELMRAASQAILVMAERDPPETTSAPDSAWSRAIEQVIGHPERVEPSLRFLVASALYAAQGPAPAGSSRPLRAPRQEEWKAFEAKLADRLQKLQSPESGYFDSAIRWECFDGGVAYDTALAVLALTVEERHDAWAAARRNLEKPR